MVLRGPQIASCEVGWVGAGPMGAVLAGRSACAAACWLLELAEVAERQAESEAQG
ncbi:MAG: hypothetical protein LC790_03855 [Actinobacteria bacterium]|nr:hypothetical protein [Actinomycetota bacterium]MCA1698066.1 hypothetical protein [Actinomycetota bacterium]